MWQCAPISAPARARHYLLHLIEGGWLVCLGVEPSSARGSCSCHCSSYTFLGASKLEPPVPSL